MNVINAPLDLSVLGQRVLAVDPMVKVLLLELVIATLISSSTALLVLLVPRNLLL